MKSIPFVILCCALMLGVSLLSGCSKVKSLLGKKDASPSPTPNAIATSASAPAPVTATSTAGNPAPRMGPVAASAPATAAIAPAINKSAAVVVLCYHRFEEKPHDSLAIASSMFEEQMQALKDNKFSVIPMQDFLAWRRGEKDIPARSAIVTIDDGYISGYDTAWPILKKFGYPFTMFVYIRYINSGGKSISWDQLAEMRDAGVDIQCHTYSHGDLRSPQRRGSVDKTTAAAIDKDIKELGVDGWMHKEIVESKQVLEKQLGIRVNALAYPFGNYNQKVRDIVKEAGYEAAFTVYGQRIGYTTPASDLLGRYAVVYNDPKVFQSAINMIGGGSGGAPPPEPAVAQLAAASMITQPMEGETIGNAKPVIKANLATMGEIDPKSVQMRVSGLGLVPAKYDAKTKTVSYQVTQPLQASSYTVILSTKVGGKTAETRWTFNFDPTKK